MKRHQEYTAATHEESCAGTARPSASDHDDNTVDMLKAFLDCRSRKVDPPAEFVAAWEQFYGAYAPRVRAFLGRSGLQEADWEDCLQDLWKEVVAQPDHLPRDPRHGRLWAWLRTVAGTMRWTRSGAAGMSGWTWMGTRSPSRTPAWAGRRMRASLDAGPGEGRAG